jgi:catechol 2,3-dioxygenase
VIGLHAWDRHSCDVEVLELTMKVESLGHLVLKVRDLDRSEQFYSGVLGMPVCARFDDKGLKMTFFSLGNHHDLAIMQVSGEEASAGEQAVGLHHVAFCIGRSMDQLREAKAQLEAAGVETDPIDYDVTKSLYFVYPDGHNIELYVDVSDAWKKEPQRIAVLEPLEL